MKITNWDDGDGLKVDGLWVNLDEYEHVTVTLPSGHRVDVFSDHIRVAAPGTRRTTDGKRIWDRHAERVRKDIHGA